HAIESHRQSKDPNPETKEAQILSDADKLDALGAITIGRIFSTGGKTDRPLHDPDIPPRTEDKPKGYSKTTINGFYEKLLRLKPENFYTKKAKELAKGRYNFVKIFLERFLKEWEGEL
ncbi:MAG: HD domain-containing protein, partial [Candidatus Pacearchaeota archaeon]|nr:HD domain-containing protein [Candidatus Pacearchaeota archaeon]